jgi:hypothetical protein
MGDIGTKEAIDNQIKVAATPLNTQVSLWK